MSSPKTECSRVVTPKEEHFGQWPSGKGGTTSPWLFLVVLLPIFAAYAILFRQRLSVPYHDDYGVILTFANEYAHLRGFTPKILAIATAQNNDYKLGLVHFVVAMELELTGHLSFAFLVSFGNCLLLAIAYLLSRVYRTHGSPLNQRLLEFLPIGLIFFSLTYWESVDWAMAGLQNLSVILFSLLSIYLLAPKERSPLSFPVLLAACISAMLAGFSSANGFLLAPVGGMLLLRRRAFVAAAIWCTSFVLPIAAYRYHYVPYHVSVNTMHHGSYLGKLAYYFAFLGCTIQQRWVATLLGLIIFGLLVLATRYGFERANPISYYFSVWILLTAAPVAWLRQGIAPRYGIYSLLLLITCYWCVVEFFLARSTAIRRKRCWIVATVLALILCIGGDVLAYVRLGHRKQLVMLGIENYRSNPAINSPQSDPEIRADAPQEDEFERATLTRSIAEHIYELPPAR